MSNSRDRYPSPPPPSSPGNLVAEYTISLSVVGGVVFLSMVCCLLALIAYKRGSSLSMKDLSEYSSALVTRAPAAAGSGGGGPAASATMSNLAASQRPSTISEDEEDEEAAGGEEESVLTAEDRAMTLAIEAAWADPKPHSPSTPAKPKIIIDDGREFKGEHDPNRKESMDGKLRRKSAARMQEAVRAKQEVRHREERARMLKMGGRPKAADFEGWTHEGGWTDSLRVDFEGSTHKEESKENGKK